MKKRKGIKKDLKMLSFGIAVFVVIACSFY